MCGQIDMNLHELMHELRFCCSRFIRKHVRRLTYEEPSGFERVYPHKRRKDTARMKRTPQETYNATEPAAQALTKAL